VKEKNYVYYHLKISVVEEMMLWLGELREDGENERK
jgi:hypothetical protein